MTATIQPVLHYGDLTKALAFLGEAFGFTEVAAHRGPDGELAYVELEFQGCAIGAGATSKDGGSPFDLGPSAYYASIDDPDTLFTRASAAGAEIVMGLTDQPYGSREFAARDLEGNVWCFGTYRPSQASGAHAGPPGEQDKMSAVENLVV